MAGVGKRTSVYLSDDLAAAVAGSGVPLAELIRRGLGAPARRPARPEAPPAVEAPGPGAPSAKAPARRRCPHPGTRVIGGWCGPCGALVEAGGYLPA